MNAAAQKKREKRERADNQQQPRHPLVGGWRKTDAVGIASESDEC